MTWQNIWVIFTILAASKKKRPKELAISAVLGVSYRGNALDESNMFLLPLCSDSSLWILSIKA